MSLSHDEFVADVAAVYTGGSSGAFGSGRLIAPGLILTAGHVVDYPTREAPTRTGWKVRLLREQMQDGAWGKPHDAERVWRGLGDLDLALLQVSGDPKLLPTVEPVFASIKWVEPVAEVYATGFPEAWRTKKRARDFNVPGTLWIATLRGPYAWIVLPAASPDERPGWKGISGAAVCHVGPGGKLYLFGVVQEVPANFSQGQLEIARLSTAFEDDKFRKYLQTALCEPPRIETFELGQSRPDLGIAHIFQTRTRAFTDEYLVSETGPVPFGGRDPELHRLDAWLFDPNAPPRMLVTAPAGRGKSALLVQWMKILQNGGISGPDGWQLVFMPISIRVGTNRPAVFYEGLARRLAEIMDEALPGDAIRDGDGFRYAVRDLLDRIGDGRILLVIDGLDEALQGRFDTAILPAILPPNLRVLFSARWQVGDSDSKGWLKRLGWDRGAKVESFELDRLKANGVTDVVIKLGAPVDIVAREPDLIERLVDLTQGEPLLVRYYAEDLWQFIGKRARITRADLDLLKPGFGSYFERWFDRQEELWQEEKAGIDRMAVDRMLAVLAFALGPLEAADLLALMKCIHGTSGVIAADRLLEPLRRFVFGNGKRGSGYVLSHPKIGNYLQQERFAASAGDLCRGFAAWGQAHLGDLNAGRIKPEEASPYALQFLPQHLDQAGASPEDFMMMVEDGWRRAWDQLEGGSRGFASAVQAAWNAQRQKESNPTTGAQWRCALTLSSVKSIGQNVPKELALAAAQQGVLTVREAANLSDLNSANNERVELLAKLAVVARDSHALGLEMAFSALAMIPMVHEESRAALLEATIETFFEVDPGLAPENRPAALNEAFAIAKALNADYSRSRALAALVPHLEPNEKSKAVDQVLDAARSIADKYLHSHALAAAALRLEPEQRLAVIDEALTVAKGIDDWYLRSMVLALLVFCVEPERVPAAVDDALGVAKSISDPNQRSSLLAALAPHLRSEQLSEALAAAKATSDESTRSNALVALAPHIGAEQLSEALVVAEALPVGVWRARAVAALAPRLEPGQRTETLAAAEPSEIWELGVFPALAPLLDPEQRSAVLEKALAIAKSPNLHQTRSDILAELAPYLGLEQLAEALAACKAIGDGYWRSKALLELARLLEPGHRPSVLNQALAVAIAIADESNRAIALGDLASYLSPEQLSEALAAAKAIGDEFARVRALRGLVNGLGPEQLSEALTAAEAFTSGAWRSMALMALAPRLGPEQLKKAVAVGQSIDDAYERARILSTLAVLLGPEQRCALLNEALAAAKSIDDNFTLRLSALVCLVGPHLGFEQRSIVLSDALAAIKAIDDDDERASALAEFSGMLERLERPRALDEALAAARAACKKNESASALGEMKPLLGKEQLSEAWAFIKAMSYERPGGDALPELPPNLGPEQMSESLAAAKSVFTDDHSRFVAIAQLASRLQPQQLSEALADAEAIGDERWRSSALAALAPYLQPEQLNIAFVCAKAISDKSQRIGALAALLTRLPSPIKGDALLQLINTAGNVRREEALMAAVAGLQPTFEVGGKESLLELYRAINDVCRWYP